MTHTLLAWQWCVNIMSNKFTFEIVCFCKLQVSLLMLFCIKQSDYCLLFAGLTLRPWKLEYVSPNQRQNSTRLHDIILRKIVLFIVTVVRTPNLSFCYNIYAPSVSYPLSRNGQRNWKLVEAKTVRSETLVKERERSLFLKENRRRRKRRTKEVSENEKLSKGYEAKPPGFRKVRRWL